MKVLAPGVLILVLSCSGRISHEELKQEIISVEKEFCEMAQEKGLSEAFTYYAAEEAVLNRGGQIFKGKVEIALQTNTNHQQVELVWAPDFVDVSSSGDMAYTWGNYKFNAITAEGDTINSKGIFHTVWKRQANGEWRYVYD
ncbi:MAG: nuclear transport factor 2 family protein [Cyclobacteriaceae bacterium]